MSVQTSATVQAGINWSQLETQTLTKISDVGSVNSIVSLSDGSGNEQVNMLWHTAITLPAGGSTLIDTIHLKRTLFSKDTNVGFENIKAVAISNTNTNKGAYITVSATGANGFTDLFSGSTGLIAIHPKCSHGFSNAIEGWNVGAANSKFYINDVGGSGVTVSIAIVGVSGSGA